MTPEESALLSDFGAQLFYAIAALICTCTFYAAKEQEVVLAKFFWLALFYFYSRIHGHLWSNALRIWSTSRPRSFSERSSGGVTPLFIATSMVIEWFLAASALYPVSVIIIVNLEWSPLDYTLRNTYASNEEAGNHRARISSLKFAEDTQLERSQKFDNTTAN
ncbi:hypothetical protein C8J55DRAFT_588595 [Lentinula edodes]|uniref:Uncharacterized protein n=1 Tax=Lentinula lateritia TaxID=40482 RepID=A0A9W9AW33_9AGAR|nr:hypothetical protein C8J55DRAFT_588595 [Lentinula edodes]